jgi:hypothetical protein
VWIDVKGWEGYGGREWWRLVSASRGWDNEAANHGPEWHCCWELRYIFRNRNNDLLLKKENCT